MPEPPSESSLTGFPDDVSIVNLVGTVDLGVELELSTLSSDLGSAEYNPEKYSSIIYRTENNVSLLIPRSGKITLVGGKKFEDLQDAFDVFCSEISSLSIEIPSSKSDIEIQNIVVNGEFDTDIDLSILAIDLGLDKVEYEPEQFPGLVYRLDKCVALIFGSGKFVITGAKTPAEVKEAYEEVLEIVSM